jgi:Protein of unknown function VcgC/VcgE (DUF2780)
MNRREVLLGMVAGSLAPVLIASNVQAQGLSDIAGAIKDPLIGMLTSKLKVTDNQAQGGMGSMLTLAKEKMSGGDFGKLTALLPQANKYMDMAKQLGAVAGPLTNMTGLNGALSKLGMSKEATKSFVPTVTDYVGKIGGDTVQKALLGALK